MACQPPITGKGVIPMTMYLGELIVGLALAGWGLWFYLLAEKFPPPLNPFDAGPAIFPQLISLALIILGLTLSGRAVPKVRTGGKIFIKRKWNITASVFLFILYAFAMPPAGYYIATAVFIPAMLILAGENRWRHVLIMTASFLLFALGAFDVLLGVPLPK
ncbi:MAG: tripartite tricarboxylate transporter TctB family protein [Bacillota bacterium]